MKPLRIYLAGPDVFEPDPVEAGRKLQAICHDHSAVGVFPLDAILPELPGRAPRQTGFAIFEANRGLIDSCDAVLANLSPFRGPSADPGTVWELAYGFAKGKVIGGWSSDRRPYINRVQRDVNGKDEKGLTVEDFDMPDNLMIAGCLHAAGMQIEADFTTALRKILIASVHCMSTI